MKRDFSKPLIIILIFLLIPWMSLVLFDYIKFVKKDITEPSICISSNEKTSYGIGYSISHYLEMDYSNDYKNQLYSLHERKYFNLLYIIKIPKFNL